MSKCREAFLSKYKISNIKMDLSEPLNPFHTSWVAWQAAWNARGKVDAEICLEIDCKGMDAGQASIACMKAIEQENRE